MAQQRLGCALLLGGLVSSLDCFWSFGLSSLDVHVIVVITNTSEPKIVRYVKIITRGQQLTANTMFITRCRLVWHITLRNRSIRVFSLDRT